MFNVCRGFFLDSFSTSTCFVLFELIILLRVFRLVSKSVFVIKSVRPNLESKICAVHLLNSGVVIYLS